MCCGATCSGCDSETTGGIIATLTDAVAIEVKKDRDPGYDPDNPDIEGYLKKRGLLRIQHESAEKDHKKEAETA